MPKLFGRPQDDRDLKIERVSHLLSQDELRPALDLAKEIITADLTPYAGKVLEDDFFERRLGKPLDCQSDLITRVPALFQGPVFPTLVSELGDCLAPFKRVCTDENIVVKNIILPNGAINFRFESTQYDTSAFALALEPEPNHKNVDDLLSITKRFLMATGVLKAGGLFAGLVTLTPELSVPERVVAAGLSLVCTVATLCLKQEIDDNILEICDEAEKQYTLQNKPRNALYRFVHHHYKYAGVPMLPPIAQALSDVVYTGLFALPNISFGLANRPLDTVSAFCVAVGLGPQVMNIITAPGAIFKYNALTDLRKKLRDNPPELKPTNDAPTKQSEALKGQITNLQLQCEGLTPVPLAKHLIEPRT